MEGEREANYHFKQLIEGAPPQIMGELGKALLVLDAQRRGEKVDAAVKLRGAWIKLARYLIRDVGLELNPEQQLFLLSGALGDSVTAKNSAGERVAVELVPGDTYEQLLAVLDAQAPRYLLSPLKRMVAMAAGEITPLNLDKPGRYREPGSQQVKQADLVQLKRQLQEAVNQLGHAQQRQKDALNAFLKNISTDRLKPMLSAVKELGNLAKDALKVKSDAARLADLAIPAAQGAPALREPDALGKALAHSLSELGEADRQLLELLHDVSRTAGGLGGVMAGDGDLPATTAMPVRLDPAAAKAVESDVATVHGVMTQLLLNDAKRSTWSSSRVLLQEQVDKVEDPSADSFATPANLAASIAKIAALHPNCFPHDAGGNPVLPPVFIEPGVGVAEWYDDRFILSFVCSDPPRKGGKLSLSPVDLAVLRIFGQFLARGDLFDYRGDRATDSFIADYAGEIEQKTKVKFTGKEKKITYTSTTEVKDAASREDAVEDYVDFIFHVFNGTTIPKRITQRRIGVILQYCLIGNEELSATLALKHALPYDPQVARGIVNQLAERNDVRIVELVRTAIENDPQLASRFRRDVGQAIKELMGHDFYSAVKRDGLLGERRPAAQSKPGEPAVATDQPPPPDHDYFDV